MILPVASDVKISWNGATRETAEKVMIGSRFDKQLANLKEFLQIRDQVPLVVRFNFTLYSLHISIISGKCLYISGSPIVDGIWICQRKRVVLLT